MKFAVPVLTLLCLFISACGSTPKWHTAPLKNSQWQLVSINQQALTLAEPITLNFIQARQVNGFSGCNRFFGELTQNTLHIQVTKLGMTRKACSEDVNQFEDALLSTLTGPNQSVMAADTLTLSAEHTLIFKRI